ncbi:transmembrane and ubiquitin-like [Desmophyllum pertusum]|uniref:Transmembrane and ubiquitin-like n=1 Tax=Desmophyllum pertusum TaxID=174260 RepID=A0A9W9ZZK3_9CNID|nr:transmembrane and ubiquitin-like [Desmophyllum pertusum]
MAAPIIEGIDNEVFFVVSVFVAFVTIFLVHLLYKSNRHEPNVSSASSDSNSDRPSSPPPEDRTQENSTEGRGTDQEPVTDELNQTTTSPSRNDAADEEPVNDANIPSMESTSEAVRWRGQAESTPNSDSQSSQPGDNIAIRVKFMENERTMSVKRTITVGELKRLCFLNDLNSGRRVRLIFSGRLLQDDSARISFYGVSNYSVVHAQISDARRDPNEQSTRQNQEEDLDISKLFLPLLAVILVVCWYGFFCYRHLFSATSIIILVFMTLAYGVLVHVMTS